MIKKHPWDKYLVDMAGPETDKYMTWLKDNPSIILNSSNTIIDGGVDFTCGVCNNVQTISPLEDEDMRQPVRYHEWHCPICGSDHPLSNGAVNTMLIRLN